MEHKLIVTYAVLAYLKETSDRSNTSIFDIYIPLVKKALSVYSVEHNSTQIMGRSFTEIKDKISNIFGISIPIPILSKALKTIDTNINDDSVFKLHKDNSFIIQSYAFSDIDDIITTEKDEVEKLKIDFDDFCKNNDCTAQFEELVNFIKAQEIDLFTNNKSNFLYADSLLPKYLDKVIKEKSDTYKIVCNLYLGSLLASYFELKLDKIATNVKLLIDTNFFISLIDLNTEDAFSVCNQVFTLCKQMGYQFSILESTLNQIEILLNTRIQNFGYKDFMGSVRTADIFDACIRRNIQKTELEAIKDSVRKTLKEYEIEIVLDAQVRDLIEKARKQKDYEELKKRRQNDDSALNDVVAKLYVEKYRGKPVSSFSDVKCWFLHNSYSPHEYSSNHRIYDRWSIGANELLVLLWIASPAQSNIKTEIVANGGIASYITKYRRAKTPSTTVLKGIKQKMDKAISLGVVDEKTIYNLTIRMSEGSVDNKTIDDLDKLENDDFVSKLNEFKDSNKGKDSKIETLKQNLDSQNKTITQQNETIIKQDETITQQNTMISKLNSDVEKLKNDMYNKERNEYISKGMKKCNIYTIGYIAFVIFLIVLWLANNKHIIVAEPWASAISLLLAIVPVIGIPFINHTKIKEFFCRNSLRNRLKQEFESKNNEI